MSTTTALSLKIKPQLLLAIYACIPLCFILVLVDSLLLSADLKNSLSVDPNNYALFTLLFTLPHILSSFFGFFEKEYFITYKTTLLKGARYAVFAAILLPFISLNLAFVVFALFTMFHVFRQQSGIAKSLMHGSNKLHIIWEYFGVLLSLALYIDLYTLYNPPDIAKYVWVVGFIVFTVLGFKAVRAARMKIGRQYFWMTHLIPLASAIFLVAGYPILSIAVPRIIHDLTGYTFYITHDYNRYTETGGNYIYRIFSNLKLPVTIINPVLSVLLALLIQMYTFGGLYMTLTVLFLLHYYTEAFIWKRGSLHRRYIEYSH
ncbi:hypothetical protein KBD20_03705 [Candidatus Saccharibacteria bacterium]|nr:hypothetical protein [Candidatus Saccharibacteria bacterium]